MNFSVQLREKTKKGYNRQLKAQGLNAGIVYGMGDARLIQMRSDQALRFIKSLHGAKKAIELKIENDQGKAETKKVILHDYQMSNWGGKLLHIDFLEVTDETSLNVDVPIHVSQDCKAIKMGGVLQIIRRKVPVRCAIKDIPEFISVNVADLDIGESIHILDLDYPKGVTPVVTGRNFTILTVSGRMKEIVEEEEEEVASEEGEEAEKETTEKA